MTEHHDKLIEAVRGFARDYNALSDTITLKVDGQQHRIPSTSVRVCPKGCHLAVAHRWEQRCDGCGQDIASGALGLHTHFGNTEQPRCVEGHYDFQHFCGRVMPPTEHIVELDDAETAWQIQDHVEQAAAQARRELSDSGRRQARIDGDDIDTIDTVIKDAIDDFAEWLVKSTLVELHRQVESEKEEVAEALYQRLFDELEQTLELVYQGHSVEDLDLTNPLDPGVHYEDGEFDAWDIDPRGDDEPIVVTPRDFDLIGVAEVARLAGIREQTVRVHIKRGAIVEPLRVLGSHAVVWHRSTIDDWLKARSRS